MIGYLSGRPVSILPDRLVLLCGSVGYEVRVTATALRRIAGQEGPADLHVHTDVREGAIELFGFETAAELALFRLLITVERIGGRLALKVLDTLSPQTLVQAVLRGDRRALVAVPGIGAKAAEKIILDLRDRMAGVDAAEGQTPGSGGARIGTVTAALVSLGFQEREAIAAAQSAAKTSPGATEDELLRLALQVLRPV